MKFFLFTNVLILLVNYGISINKDSNGLDGLDHFKGGRNSEISSKKILKVKKDIPEEGWGGDDETTTVVSPILPTTAVSPILPTTPIVTTTVTIETTTKENNPQHTETSTGINTYFGVFAVIIIALLLLGHFLINNFLKAVAVGCFWVIQKMCIPCKMFIICCGYDIVGPRDGSLGAKLLPSSLMYNELEQPRPGIGLIEFIGA